ncbi:MAG: L,D-transpeptidase family protein, partial [Caulobacteraceae bacterium]|nr:L,D-transpeptidase family protein [Caulobacter sp.]
MNRLFRSTALGAISLGFVACSQGGGDGQAKASPQAPPARPAAAAPAPPAAPAPAPAPGAPPLGPAGAQALADRINGASYAPPPPSEPKPGADIAPDPMLIKAQVLLARADASPGVIDGLRGSNFQHAISAFEAMNGIDDSHGVLTQAVWAKLTAGAPQPVAAIYTVTPQDVAGPYYPDVGENLVAMSKLPEVGYSRPSEMLAERFHMSEDALKALNPGADFGKAGTVIVVAEPGDIAIPRVDHIQVDKAKAAVRAYNREGKEIAFIPATVGSTDRPSPTGTHKVNGVAHNPKYTYDPK